MMSFNANSLSHNMRTNKEDKEERVALLLTMNMTDIIRPHSLLQCHVPSTTWIQRIGIVPLQACRRCGRYHTAVRIQ